MVTIESEIYRSKTEYGLKNCDEHGHYEIQLSFLSEREPFATLKYRTKSRVINAMNSILTRSFVDERVKSGNLMSVVLLVKNEGAVFTHSVWQHVDTLYVEDLTELGPPQIAWAPPYKADITCTDCYSFTLPGGKVCRMVSSQEWYCH
jgi:hypothetical protein